MLKYIEVSPFNGYICGYICNHLENQREKKILHHVDTFLCVQYMLYSVQAM